MNKKITRKIARMSLATVLAFGGIVNTANAAEVMNDEVTRLTKKVVVSGDNTYRPNLVVNFNIEGTTEGITTDSDGNALNVTAAPDGLVSLARNQVSFDGTKKGTAYETIVMSYNLDVLERPGVYRFKVTETTNDVDGITNDTYRIVDLYIRNSDTDPSGFEIANTVVTKPENLGEDGNPTEDTTYVKQDGTDPDGTGETGKPDTTDEGDDNGNNLTGENGETLQSVWFVNEYDTVDLDVSKEVTGEMGDKDRKFEFTININKADPDQDSRYAVTGQTDDATGLTPDPDGEGLYVQNNTDFKVLLGHNDTIKITGLSAGDTYTVVESEPDLTGYTKTGEQTNFVAAGTENKEVNVVNNYTELTPTGLIDNTTPYIIVLSVAVIGGIVYLTAKKQRDSELA